MIKELYKKRWGIETSFRELKYSDGLVHNHHKKKDSVIKEIYSRMILFNFCESIFQHIDICKESKKYIYQLNKNTGILLCKNFLNNKLDSLLEKLLIKNLVFIKQEESHHFRQMRPNVFIVLCIE